MVNSVRAHIEKENRLHPEIARWFVIYTKYKTDKYVCDLLRKKNIKSYIPLIKYSKRYTRKIVHREVPLINCYVFVKIISDEYLKVLETDHVSAFLKNRGNLTDVKQEEIEILQRIVGEEQVQVSETIQFQKGRKVEIISGNLTGLKGMLIEKKGKREFTIELESIGYQFRMNIDQSQLRPI